MITGTSALRVRIYLSTTDQFRHKPLYQVIVYAAHRYRLAGATVLKGTMGFGASGKLFSESQWEMNEKRPLVIELVDQPEAIRHFLERIRPYFSKSGQGVLITCETVSILHSPTIPPPFPAG